MSKEERRKLTYRMTSGGLNELQAQAAMALSCVDKCKEGGFVELFMTKVNFHAKFDYCMRLNLNGKPEVFAQRFCLDNECWRLYEDKGLSAGLLRHQFGKLLLIPQRLKPCIKWMLLRLGRV